jgi:cobaltochelatase CobT
MISPLQKKITTKEAITATTRALAKNHDLKISFGETRNADVFLPPLEDDSTPLQRDYVRGEADRSAFIIRYHDGALHKKQRPQDGAALFDMLETIRVETLGASDLQGAQYNLTKRYERLCAEKQLNPHALPFSATLELFARRYIQQLPLPDFLRAAVEEPSKEFSKALPLLKELRSELVDQKNYSKAAQKLIKALSQSAEKMERSEEKGSDEKKTEPEKENESQSETSPKPQTEENESSALALAQLAAKAMQGKDTQKLPPETSEIKGTYPFNYQDDGAVALAYHIYTERFDETVNASALATPTELDFLRRQLDTKLEQFRGLTSRLAGRLQRLLMAKQARKWVFDQEDGVLDSKKLSRLIMHPDEERIYKREEETDFRDTVVTLLIDNSGSMRGRPITMAAMCADILSRTLERCGVKAEILGFTTKEWKGGQSYKQWLKDNRPANPGRLNDIRHIIYKPADAAWRSGRKNLGLMLKEGILKENIDGEAIVWAVSRLMKRPEQRRILMVISDGAPVDDTTLSANGGSYLDKHLREVIANIENHSPVELLAIGIGHDVTRYYQRAVTISDIDKLAETMTAQLAELFGAKRK